MAIELGPWAYSHHRRVVAYLDHIHLLLFALVVRYSLLGCVHVSVADTTLIIARRYDSRLRLRIYDCKTTLAKTI